MQNSCKTFQSWVFPAQIVTGLSINPCKCLCKQLCKPFFVYRWLDVGLVYWEDISCISTVYLLEVFNFLLCRVHLWSLVFTEILEWAQLQTSCFLCSELFCSFCWREEISVCTLLLSVHSQDTLFPITLCC